MVLFIKKRLGHWFFLGLLLSLYAIAFWGGSTSVLAETFYVATTGNNNGGDGSSNDPWATISYALGEIEDGDTISVRPGSYNGRIYLRRSFAQGVLIKSETDYQALLRNDNHVFTSYDGCHGVTIEGFDIAHSGSGSGALVIHLDGGGENPYVSPKTSRITLRNNVLHDSYNNDILKINNNASDILVEGNLFYNQAGSDEHIDVNSVTNVTIQDNVFFNDFTGSGRADTGTSSFIVIKDSNDNHDGIQGSDNITVRRNVFFHWEGSSGHGFVRVGEDGASFHEARNVLIENNLMLGNNLDKIRSPFQLMGVFNVTIRANTVAGDLYALEYGARIFTHGANPNNDQIHLHNNIWSDPTGTMGDTFNRGDDTDNLTFDNNLFWNNGNPFPTSSESIIEVDDDANRIIGDPLLGDQSEMSLPRWVPEDGEFKGGFKTIREVFKTLVKDYGTPRGGSPAIDAADPDHMPDEDILGNKRTFGSAPDVGAVEHIYRFLAPILQLLMGDP